MIRCLSRPSVEMGRSDHAVINLTDAGLIEGRLDGCRESLGDVAIHYNGAYWATVPVRSPSGGPTFPEYCCQLPPVSVPEIGEVVVYHPLSGEIVARHPPVERQPL